MADSRFRDQPEIFRRGLCEAMSPPDVRIVPCEACGSEGRIYIATGDDRETSAPQERDGGPCPYCEGTGGEIVAVQPITIEDLNRHGPPRPRLGSDVSNRVQLVIHDELLNQIGSWRFENRVGSLSEAIRRLCEIALKAEFIKGL